MNKDLTEVVFILDRSGSMSGLEKDVIGGFNSTISKQRKESEQCIISTVLFNDKSKVIHDRVDIKDVPLMSEEDYQPSGCTALIDAMGDAIKYIKKAHKIIRKEDVPARTMFIITTDGYENSSKKYSSKEVKKMVCQQQENGWEFIYLAANIDAVETSKQYGFKESRVANYINDEIGTNTIYKCLNNMVKEYKTGNFKEDWAKEINIDYQKRRK